MATPEARLAARLPLSRRAAAVERTLLEDVPDWLYPRLAEWLWHVLQFTNDAVRVLRPGHGTTAETRDVMLHLQTTTQPWLISADDPRFLDAIDAALGRCNWDAVGWGVDDNPASLEQILATANSAWRVNADGTGLERRVDESVTAAAHMASAAAGGQAAEHLAAAWSSAYGRRPDPDKVFNEAIRAVESVACPLVLERAAAAGTATLGTVIGELAKNASHKWELVLPGADGQPSNVTPLVSMLSLLWQAQVSRHGGAAKSRRQHQAEAEAAVHLAAVLVHWLSTGVLRKKP